MSKHNNKYWLREKQYRSLLKERESIWDETTWRYGLRSQHKRLQEIYEILKQRFYDEEYGWYQTAPKHYRKTLNRIQRAKQKQVMHKIISGEENFVFEDSYKDAPWYW